MKMSLHTVTFCLLIIGGLNWLLRVFGWDIEHWSFLPMVVDQVVYVLVGLSAIYEAVTHKGRCKMCDKAAAPAGGAQM